MKFLVCEDVSGDAITIEATSPLQAVIEYLKQDIEPNLDSRSWAWEFIVERIYSEE